MSHRDTFLNDIKMDSKEKFRQRFQFHDKVRSSFGEKVYQVWTSLCSFGSDSSLDKIHPNKDVEVSTEFSSKSEYHSGIITKAFLPMRLTLMAMGRWPFLLKLKPVSDGDSKQRKFFHRLRVLYYDSSLKSPIWIYFGLTTLSIWFALLMSTLGFFDFFLEWRLLPAGRWATIQKNTFRNNLVMFLLVWGCLLHSTLSSLAMFLNRRRISQTLNFWNVAVEELQIGSVKSHRRFLIGANFGYVLFLIMIYFAYSWWNIRFVRDGATLFGTLAFLPFLTEHHLSTTEEWKLRVLGILMIIYCVYASRAFLFIFCFKCRLLRTLFKNWNRRLCNYLETEEGALQDKHERIESSRILREMTILLKMVKQTDLMFATVLQSYYSIQLLNMCFELYMLAKSGTRDFSGSETNRSLDIISALVTLLQNVYFFFTVSLDGARVGEEAAEGLEILRTHHVTPTSSVYRKYLVYNLSFIFHQRIALTGGKFFTIDRPFIITVLGAVFTYFVIILQMGPKFHQDIQPTNYVNNTTV